MQTTGPYHNHDPAPSALSLPSAGPEKLPTSIPSGVHGGA